MANARRSPAPANSNIAAVKPTTEQDPSVAEAARRLGLNAQPPASVEETLQTSGDQAFPGQGVLPPLEEENRRLAGGEQARLQMERDILKKRQAFLRRRVKRTSASSKPTTKSGP